MVELKHVDMTKLAAALVKDASIVSSVAKGLGNVFWKNRSPVGKALAIGLPTTALAASNPASVVKSVVNPNYQNRFDSASQEYSTRLNDFRDKNEAFLKGTGANPTQGLWSRASNYLFGSSNLSPEARKMQYDQNMEALRQGNVGANFFGFNSLGSVHNRAMNAANAINQGKLQTGGAVEKLLGANTPANFEAIKAWQSQYGDMSRLGKIAPTVKPNNPGYTWSPSTQNEYNIGRNYTPLAGAAYTQG